MKSFDKNAYARAWYAENKEKCVAWAARWRAANEDHCREYDRQRHLLYREKLNEACKRYQEANREKVKAQSLLYRQQNRELLRARRRAFYATEIGRAQRAAENHRRRFRKIGGSVSRADIARVLAADRCHICHKRFTKANPAVLDHVIPLAKGGANEVTNLAAAHHLCNLHKHVRASKTR
jgi:5-methylcytosine-specific restriction endonuclease McrA